MEKKTLADYLLQIKKDHEYTVRIAKCVPTDDDMTRIENNLKAYELLEISRPKKTIFQEKPYGWAEPINSDVYIFNVKTSLPASCFYLGREIARILKISEIYVVVHGLDNPAPELDLEPSGKVVPEFSESESEDLYGDKYNLKMLKTILAARDKDPESIVQTAKK